MRELENSLENLRLKICKSLAELERKREEEAVHEARKEEMMNQLQEFIKAAKGIKDILDSQSSNARPQGELMEKLDREIRRLDQGLPIYARRSDVVKMVHENRVSILVAETGAGKSTQCIQYLADAGQPQSDRITPDMSTIVCTQPRKVAAVSLANRVAEEFGCRVGQDVGYKVGGARARVSTSTRLKFVTARVLLDELIEQAKSGSSQWNLSYSVIIVDEAHERSIDTDLLLGLLKQCLKQPYGPHVVITSATLDKQLFNQFFTVPGMFSCDYKEVSGRTFPVDIEFAEIMEDNYISAAASMAVKIHTENKTKGHILVFLAGQKDIESVAEKIQMSIGKDFAESAIICPLHGKLPPEEQQKVFEPTPEGKRKIVLSTNTAETSVTIDGVTVVIDSGMCKENIFDSRKNMNVLDLCFITKSNAIQRAGRAGRTQPGICYRLYSLSDYENFEPFRLPEILRVDLALALLKVKQMGIARVTNFEFIERPDEAAFERSRKNLMWLGAIDEHEVLTSSGEIMAKFSFGPHLSKMLIQGVKYQCLSAVTDIVSVLISAGGSLFWRGSDALEQQRSDQNKSMFCSDKGDFITILNVIRTCRNISEKQNLKRWCSEHNINNRVIRDAEKNRKEIMDSMREVGLDAPETSAPFATEDEEETAILRVIASSLFQNLCVTNGHQSSSGYNVLEMNQNVLFHPSSSFVTLGEKPTYVVYYELAKTSRFFIRNVSVIPDLLWIQEEAPEFYRVMQLDKFNSQSRSTTPQTFTSIGPALMRTIFGKRSATLIELERKLDIIIEFKPDENSVVLWAKSGEAIAVQQQFSEFLHSKRQDLRDEVMETGIIGSTRILFGKGGLTQRVLLSDEYVGVSFDKVPITMSDFDMEKFLSRYGTVKDVKLLHNGSKKLLAWGHAVFTLPESARLAVEEGNGTVIGDDKSIVIKRRAFQSNSVVAEQLQETTLKVEWFVGKSKGMGFVRFVNEEDWTKAIAELNGKSFPDITTRRVLKVTASTKDYVESGYQICIKNLDFSVDEMQLTKFCRDMFGPVIETRILREVNNAGEEQLDMAATMLRSIFSQYGTIIDMHLFPPRDKKFRGKAFVVFQTVESATRASDATNGKSDLYGSGRLYAQPDCSLRLKLWTDVFDSVRGKFLEYKSRIEKEISSVSVSLVEKSGKGVTITIQGDDMEETAKAKILLESTVMDYTCIDEINDLFILTTREAKDKIKKIMMETGCCISIVRQRKSVIIYGTKSSQQEGSQKVKEFIEKSREEKPWRRKLPRGCIKFLVKRNKPGFQNIVDSTGIHHIEFNAFRQELSVRGNQKAVTAASQKLETDIGEYLTKDRDLTTSVPSDDEVICPVCWCEPENGYTLHCGHMSCRDCLSAMIQSVLSDRSFPFKCSKEGCDEHVILKDLLDIIGDNSMSRIFDASFSKFIDIHMDTFIHCKTPNCNQVFRRGENVIQCDQCLKKYCIPCDTEYHVGQTCEQYQVTKEWASDELQEYLRTNDVRPCPRCHVPIEKHSGCNRMTCTQCNTSICWFDGCMKHFDSAGECYQHMQSIHGSY